MPVFVDTNVVVYVFGQDAASVERAEAVFDSQPTISAQVIIEFLEDFQHGRVFDASLTVVNPFQ